MKNHTATAKCATIPKAADDTSLVESLLGEVASRISEAHDRISILEHRLSPVSFAAIPDDADGLAVQDPGCPIASRLASFGYGLDSLNARITAITGRLAI